MRPEIEAAADENPEVNILWINASESTGVAEELGVRATPTLIGYNGGTEVFRWTGRLSKGELGDLFSGLGRGGSVRVGKSDLVLSLAAGVGLAALGLLSGPTWVLVFIGAGITMTRALKGAVNR